MSDASRDNATMMTPKALQAFLLAHIALARPMQVEVRHVDDRQVVLAAPLTPNLNHHGTVFGGSAAAVAILAAWSLLHVRLDAAGIQAQLVVHRTNMEYMQPIDGDFTATGSMADPAEWDDFVQRLQRKGRARLRLNAVLAIAGTALARLEGEFVARRPD
jgi:thioesterase domain-containing protein